MARDKHPPDREKGRVIDIKEARKRKEGLRLIDEMAKDMELNKRKREKNEPEHTEEALRGLEDEEERERGD